MCIMSTTIEEIDNIQEMEEVDEYDDEIEMEEIQRPIVRKKKVTFEEPEEEDINGMIMKVLYKKLKEPVLVTFLMIIFTHPLLIKLIFNLPYIEVVEKTVSVNVMLAISTGIAFFILREFI